MSEHKQPSGVGRMVARAIVLAALVVTTGTVSALHKTVAVDVDGRVAHVVAYGHTVEDVLTAQGIATDPGAKVVPGLTDSATNGGVITVTSPRVVPVEIDGRSTAMPTTARTVGELLAELGPQGEGAIVGSPRSAPLGHDLVRVSTLKTLDVAVDGAVMRVTTSEPTVAGVLDSIELALNEGDVTSTPGQAAAVDGMLVVVARSATGTDTVTEALAFATEEVADPSLPQGVRWVVTPGKVGEAMSTYQIQTVGGVEVARTVVSQSVTREPVTEVIKVGTGSATQVAVEPGTSRAIGASLAAQRGWGDGEFVCLDQLWQKESKWSASAHNTSSGAYGIPQAMPGSKMASAGADWQTNPATQITWGLGYIAGRYGTPCAAWSHSVSKGWY